MNAYDSIFGVVLVGGTSRRFGSDKLLTDIGNGTLLVDRPIRALREGLGMPVSGVGACDSLVRARFDGMIEDLYPGAGPIGGILSALDALRGPVFVLAGDLITITPGVVGQIAEASRTHRKALAVLADTGRTQWTIGIYYPRAAPLLCGSLAQGEHAIRHAMASADIVRVPVDKSLCRNINRPEDLLSL